MCYALSSKLNHTQRRLSHEKHNTGHQVLSSDSFLCRQARRYKGCHQIPHLSPVHLPFAQSLRWYTGIPRPKVASPHHHPNQHSDEEIALIRRMRKRHPNIGLGRFWVCLRKKSYMRILPEVSLHSSSV